MKKLVLCLLAAFVLVPVFQDIAFAQNPNPECPQFNFNVLGMRKSLNNDWKPNNEQDELGANFDITGKGWPIGLDISYLYATAKGSANTIITNNNVSTAFTDLQQTATTQELGVGIKKIWTNPQDWSLFVGGGAAWVIGRLEFTGVSSFDKAALGWYGTAGVYYTVAKFLNLGVIGRYSDTNLDIAGRTLNAGGWHYGFLAGIRF